MKIDKKLCPCCGMDFLEEDYDICPTCGWEYDPVQNEKPDYRGGANKDSLNDHKVWFKKMLEMDNRFQWCKTWNKDRGSI